MKNGRCFTREDWENIFYITKILRTGGDINKILNYFVLFFSKEDFFKITAKYGIDEYGITDSDYGDEQDCFAPMDGKNILFCYWPIVGDIKISLLQQKEKNLRQHLITCLSFTNALKKKIRRLN